MELSLPNTLFYDLPWLSRFPILEHSLASCAFQHRKLYHLLTASVSHHRETHLRMLDRMNGSPPLIFQGLLRSLLLFESQLLLWVPTQAISAFTLLKPLELALGWTYCSPSPTCSPMRHELPVWTGGKMVTALVDPRLACMSVCSLPKG